MCFLSKLFGLGEDERADALETWHIYLRDSLTQYRHLLRGQRVVVKNERFAGTREAAWIIEVGLEDLGATVIKSAEPFDWEVVITRYSGDEGLYEILNAKGAEVASGNVHHQQIVSRTIQALAEQIASLNTAR